jgi:hypothetical protein
MEVKARGTEGKDGGGRDEDGRRDVKNVKDGKDRNGWKCKR